MKQKYRNIFLFFGIAAIVVMLCTFDMDYSELWQNLLKAGRRTSTHGHHQMANTKIRLITFLAAKDGETLYGQQKQDLKMTVAQTISFILQNSGSN